MKTFKRILFIIAVLGVTSNIIWLLWIPSKSFQAGGVAGFLALTLYSFLNRKKD